MVVLCEDTDFFLYLYTKKENHMSLEQQIQEAIKEAMKAKDAVALSANRAIKGEILLFKTAEGGAKEVTDGDILKMIQKLVKQRKEAAEQFVAGARQDLADNELAEAAALEKYLPKQLSPDEVKAKIQEIIAQVGATSIRDMGKVMGAIATDRWCCGTRPQPNVQSLPSSQGPPGGRSS